MVQYLFAMVDEYISDELRVKILSLTEIRGPGGYRHTILPHLDNPQKLSMFISDNSDTNLQKMTLENGQIYLWRTLYTVRYGSIRIPILDSNSRNSIPGEYSHRVPMNMQSSIEYLDNQNMIRANIMNLVQPLQPLQPLQPIKMPKFVTDALKRDALNRNYVCPINMEPLSEASITSCYHIFDTVSIKNALKTRNTCPVCREVVTFTQPI